ncbi:uncharacterized protein [Drosophila virilis]|uniref:CHK kinase-like domain-containing protein n=1 Tax=Drosophila virilis TaxID=7244 RepID=B4LX70_DROVI|nr:uncharacterized protein LOC6630741 [Drosophila virilis]EDW66722.1 uncharacterized protein Dvir_GJ23759 [Drosophila virilis]
MSESNEIVNPNEHLVIPDWITAKYFKTVLDKDEPNHVKVLKFTPVAAIPPGENFTSIMLRIYIDLEMKDGSTKTKTYIFKTMLPSERGGAEIENFGLFPKELKMYETYLHAFEALYKAAGEDIQIAPKCLHTEEREGYIHFIFEDLGVKKFRNVDRINGLDMVHMTCALRKLAEFHAASSVYEEQNGPFPSEFNEGFVSLNTDKFIKEGFQMKEVSYKKAMATWGMKDAEKYIKNYPTTEQYWAMCVSTLETDPQDFNTLTHGDFWSSNLMCNYLPDGNIDQLILVDFQICKWGSPALDLLFFITLSAANDIRLKEFDHFICIYWERLIECLKLLKYKKPLPKLRDLQASLYKKNNSFYAFFALTNHLPLIVFPTDKDSNIHSLMAETEEGENLRLRLTSNPIYANIMKDLYPFYYNRGLFNFDDYITE